MRLLILDRDGVINEDSDAFIKHPDEWVPIAGSLHAIAMATRAGARVVICTNQSGVARGLFDVDRLHQIHQKMLAAVKSAGGMIEAIFFCPHAPEEKCECRKPLPGMLHEVARRLRVPLEYVPAIGDRESDIAAARAAGARPVLVLTGAGRETADIIGQARDVAVYPDLAAVVEHLLATEWVGSH